MRARLAIVLGALAVGACALKDAPPHEDTVKAALPNVTLFIIARMILFRFARRSFSLQFASEPEERPLPAAALRQAEWLWTYERSRAQTRYEAGLLPQVAVFGLLSSATLSFCVLGIHLPPAQLFPNMTTVPTWHIWVAWTVLGTATTSFLLTIGRILVRIAGDDATTRTFANAARSYGLCVVSGGLLACLTVSTTESPETAQMSIAMGIAVGLLGDRAFLAVSNRAAALLGAEPEVVDPGNELRTIEGLGAEDQQRLQEESIGSVHALAFVPVPRLFFNSSLNLQRICDWQDQALLCGPRRLKGQAPFAEAHHRGQMTVLMRQAGLTVPGIYGPAQEEWAAMGMPTLP